MGLLVGLGYVRVYDRVPRMVRKLAPYTAVVAARIRREATVKVRRNRPLFFNPTFLSVSQNNAGKKVNFSS